MKICVHLKFPRQVQKENAHYVLFKIRLEKPLSGSTLIWISINLNSRWHNFSFSLSNLFLSLVLIFYSIFASFYFLLFLYTIFFSTALWKFVLFSFVIESIFFIYLFWRIFQVFCQDFLGDLSPFKVLKFSEKFALNSPWKL